MNAKLEKMWKELNFWITHIDTNTMAIHYAEYEAYNIDQFFEAQERTRILNLIKLVPKQIEYAKRLQDELADLYFADRHYSMKLSYKREEEIRAIIKRRID